ncbi:metal ABC transporter permease [Puniceicoccaceae bacterium K14]|nr:metal ABC transporter permease [Puniceicoccaceae bacterium K14]
MMSVSCKTGYMNGYRFLIRFGLILTVLTLAANARAAKISDLESIEFGEQLVRFFSMEDELLRTVLLGSLCLGLCCGLLGSFIVVRKLSLVGDALSHAVLPGVAIGFIVAGHKDPLAIFIGAIVAGLAGTVLVNLIKSTTHIKEDSSLGMVLAGFYGLGIVLITMVQKASIGNKAGLDKFLFGQVAALSSKEVTIMAVITVLSLVVIGLFYKQFLVGSFDAAYSKALGIPAQFFHYLLMLLLAFAVVISLQAVGAVLVSAMLIIPASSAYLLTDRMHRMLILSCLFGMGSGAMGAFFSFLGPNLPTGPLMVIAASTVFAASFFLSPKHGLVSRWLRFRDRTRRIRNENTVKAIYHVREKNYFEGEGVDIDALAARLKETRKATLLRVKFLTDANLGDVKEVDGNKNIFLNPEGWLMACTVVRNHRLWELYLTNEAEFEADHVHEDAEKIEHMLGEETVRQLERLLDFPRKDPHGKLIPSLADLQRTLTHSPRKNEPSGYRMPHS